MVIEWLMTPTGEGVILAQGFGLGDQAYSIWGNPRMVPKWPILGGRPRVHVTYICIKYE